MKRTVPFAVILICAFGAGAATCVYVGFRLAGKLLP